MSRADVDVLIGNFSLVKLPDIGCADATPVERAAMNLAQGKSNGRVTFDFMSANSMKYRDTVQSVFREPQGAMSIAGKTGHRYETD